MIALAILYFLAGFAAGTYGLYLFIHRVAREAAWRYILNKEISDETHAHCVNASRCPRCYYDIPELDWCDYEEDDE